MCLQLRARGVGVRGILLIDAPDPITHVPLSESVINSVINLDSLGRVTEMKRLIKMQFTMNTEMMDSYRPRSMDTACPPMIYLRSREGFCHPDIPDIPHWLSDRDDRNSATNGWRTLTSASLLTLDIPGHHFSPFHITNVSLAINYRRRSTHIGLKVEEVSAVMRQALEWLEKS